MLYEAAARPAPVLGTLTRPKELGRGYPELYSDFYVVDQWLEFDSGHLLHATNCTVSIVRSTDGNTITILIHVPLPSNVIMSGTNGSHSPITSLMDPLNLSQFVALLI